MTRAKYIPHKRCPYCRAMRPVYLIDSHKRRCFAEHEAKRRAREEQLRRAYRALSIGA